MRRAASRSLPFPLRVCWWSSPRDNGLCCHRRCARSGVRSYRRLPTRWRTRGTSNSSRSKKLSRPQRPRPLELRRLLLDRLLLHPHPQPALLPLLVLLALCSRRLQLPRLISASSRWIRSAPASVPGASHPQHRRKQRFRNGDPAACQLLVRPLFRPRPLSPLLPLLHRSHAHRNRQAPRRKSNSR